MLFRPRHSHSSASFLKVAIFALLQAFRVAAWGACSKDVYGSPRIQSCQQALSSLPRDAMIRFFVEQQLRPAPGTNWLAYADSRPQRTRQKIVQVPKWWSASSCNIALASYVQAGSKTVVATSATQWSKILTAGVKLLSECLVMHGQGGSAVVNDYNNSPSLTLFLWEDGAWFDDVMTDYMGSESPYAIDHLNPLTPTLLLANVSSRGNESWTMSSMPLNISIS